jgi:heme/copper-type cytochrome/quinol oxidase subunit 3
MSGVAADETAYGVVESEPAELLGRNLSSAGHLLASATAFFFLAFVFAYFYLRSLDNGGMWHPKHVAPSFTLGTLATVLVVASAVLVRLGLSDHRAARREQWRLKAAVALGLGLAAVVVQVVEWYVIGFGPGSGGYASVFFGWTASLVLFLIATLYWLETLLATAYRYRNVEQGGGPSPGHASGDAYRTAHDIADPLSLVRPGLEALSFYWSFLAGVCVLAWVVLYLL